MSSCVSSGWGSGAWGKAPWGAGPSSSIGGPLPTTTDFDVFCVGPCDPMANVLSYNNVVVYGDITNFTQGTYLEMTCGTANQNPTWLSFDVLVPEPSTFEWTINIQELPENFSSVVTNHVLVSVTTSSAYSFAFFFSRAGIGYLGAWHRDGYFDLVVDSALHTLPDTASLVPEGVSMTYRVVTDYDNGLVYFFATPVNQLLISGHQLKLVLPVFQSADAPITPASEAVISVRGTPADPTTIQLHSVCLSSHIYLPAIPPVADPGPDQAVSTCRVVQLDGSKSYDPQGLSLQYSWRLIEAPEQSQWAVTCDDGHTEQLSAHAPPAQYTNKFYSVELAVFDGLDPILPGDVLQVGGTPFTIKNTGSDVNGFFVAIDGYDLPDDIGICTFHVYRQSGITEPRTARPRFFPDVPGFFRFDLQVFNGSSFSTFENSICNVLQTNVPRGYIPDTSFLWGFLSSFWVMEEGKEFVSTFWSGVAQVVAAEMLTLYQLEYSKSIRDIQRTFQRKWVYYRMRLFEMLPDATVSVMQLGAIWTSDLSGSIVLADQQLIVSSDFLSEDVVVPLSGTYTVAQLHTAISNAFGARAPSVKATLHVGASTSQIRITAPFVITVSGSAVGLFTTRDNKVLFGTGGIVDKNTYIVQKSLEGLDLGETPVLLLDGVGYRISKVIDNASDNNRFLRIVTIDDLPVGTPNTEWTIPGFTISLQADFDKALVSPGDIAVYEVVNQETGEELLLPCTVLGTCPTLPNHLLVDLTDVEAGILSFPLIKVQLRYVDRRTRIPIDPLIVDVPYLQPQIDQKDDTQVLRRNIDFFIEEYRGQSCIRFVTGVSPDPDVWEYASPPELLWAEYTYLDNKNRIEANFGIPVGFTLDKYAELSNVDYLSSVRGLWYSYLNGPTLHNMRVGLQILLGLPFAEEAGTIIEIRNDYSARLGRVLIRDKDSTEIVRSYTYNNKLAFEVNPATQLPYKEGDAVEQFAPIVKGVDVVDYIKDPLWWKGLTSEGAFLEVEKFHRFLVRVDSIAFNLSALLFCRDFILRIKPKYTYPLFLVVSDKSVDQIEVADTVKVAGKLTIYDGAATNGARGQATLFDQPRPGNGNTGIIPQTVSDVFSGSVYNIPGSGAPIGTGWTATHNGTVSSFGVIVSGDPGFSNPDYVVELRKNGEVLSTVPITLVGPSTSVSFALGILDINKDDLLEATIYPTPVGFRYPNLNNPDAVLITFTYNRFVDPASWGSYGGVFDANGPYWGVAPYGVPPSDWVPPYNQPVEFWAFDQASVAPKNIVTGKVSIVVGTLATPAPYTPTVDSLLLFDNIVVKKTFASFADTFIRYVKFSASNPIDPEYGVEITSSGTANYILVEYFGGRQDGYTDYDIVVSVNDVDVQTYTMTIAQTSSHYNRFLVPASIALAVNDVVKARLVGVATLGQPFLHRLLVQLIDGETWAFDNVPALGAGTYSLVKSM